MIDNELIHVTAETIFISKHSGILASSVISKHSTILARRGNKQKVRHFRRCFEALCIELNSENCECIEFADDLFRFSSFYSSNQRVHCSLGLPNEPRRSATELLCSSGLRAYTGRVYESKQEVS